VQLAHISPVRVRATVMSGEGAGVGRDECPTATERDGETDRQTDRGPVMSRVCVCVGVCPFNRSSSHKPPPQPPSLDKAVASLFCVCVRACVCCIRRTFCVAAPWAVHTYAALRGARNSASCVFV